MTDTTAVIAPALTAEHLAAITAREQAATSGPWFWYGNTDYDDPQLATRRPGRGVCTVLGHMRVERTKDDQAIGRVLSECYTEEHPQILEDYLTDAYGQPRYDERMALVVDHLLTPARDLAVYEVCPDAETRDDQRVYRADIVGIRHPDAAFIAHARQDVTDLLAEVARLTTLLADTETFRTFHRAQVELLAAKRDKAEHVIAASEAGELDTAAAVTLIKAVLAVGDPCTTEACAGLMAEATAKAAPSVPQRIQLRRTKGWRLADHSVNAVVVARPTCWGNPWRIGSTGWTVLPGGLTDKTPHPPLTREQAIASSRNSIEFDSAHIEIIRAALGGKDLACWCRLDDPCHADVLLQIANPEPTPDIPTNPEVPS